MFLGSLLWLFENTEKLKKEQIKILDLLELCKEVNIPYIPPIPTLEINIANNLEFFLLDLFVKHTSTRLLSVYLFTSIIYHYVLPKFIYWSPNLSTQL
jgi:hypothetical protein